MRKSLNIISNKKNFHIDTSEQDLKQSRSKSVMSYGAGSNGNGEAPEDDGDDMYNVGNNSKKKEEESKATEGTTGTQDKTKTDTEVQTYNMNVYIQDLLKQLGRPLSVTFDTSTNKFSNESIANEISGSAELVELATTAASWDPRLYRVDAYIANDNFVVPFSTQTASSAYYDHVFTIESGIIKEVPDGGSNAKNTSTTSGNNGSNTLKYKANGNPDAGDKVAPNKAIVDELKADSDMFGVASLVNPYCVTRLCGGLTGTKEKFNTHYYDIRDTRRFYDNAGSVKFTDRGNQNSGYLNSDGGIVETDDLTSINNPTTTNIIRWSNRDVWGRTPYSFQDFVFSKHFNIISNNRLITLRKYAVPTYDNLNFTNMVNDKGSEPTTLKASPIATVVTYFGGDTGNKLNDLLKFTTGTKWKTIDADIHKVTGDTGSNPRAVIDSMFERGGFAGISSKSEIVNNFLGKIGGVSQNYMSWGKFVGLLDPDGYAGHSQEAWEKLQANNMDPTEQLYSNRVIGPVNRIQSVLKRDAGIEFEQSFNITFTYIARPIGSINTKAAMLDILSNCMEIASPEAIFWGGGYRFEIHPNLYPFKRGGGSNRMIDRLYAGKIFGNDGAIAEGLRGLSEFGKRDKDGNVTSSFEWSNVTSRLGSVLSQTVGALGNMLTSISSTLFGESSNLTLWLLKGTDMAASKDDLEKGTNALNNLLGNVNKMWHDAVIKETTLPNIQGMGSILTGEPVGNIHLTVGNPLNPIMVVGNLICKKMSVEFGDELGPDDFPIEMKVVYTVEHGMPRDKAAIQSMFNRGTGKIYKLPDYIKSVSDYETKVDDWTGLVITDRTDLNSFTTPKYMLASEMMAKGGAKGYKTYKITEGKALAMTGNAKTTMIAKFTPADPQISSPLSKSAFLRDTANIATYSGNFFTRKSNDN